MVNSVAVSGLTYVATTVGNDHATEIVDFTLAGDPNPPVRVVEVIQFRGDQICEIRPYYFDPSPFIEAAARKPAESSR